ncbi:hypothetical protein [Clostridium rectalis]|nr:hypothetical protein [Clostridium rectalis]
MDGVLMVQRNGETIFVNWDELCELFDVDIEIEGVVDEFKKDSNLQ